MTESANSANEEEKEINSTLNKLALKIMQKMGYKLGSGLGKNEEGCLEPIESTIKFDNKYGFGYKQNKICENELTIDNTVKWNFDCEKIVLDEKVLWLANQYKKPLNINKLEEWIIKSLKTTDVEDENNFCDSEMLKDILKAKGIFNRLDETELYNARAKANCFETIKSVFFMNRASLKMANIDYATGFMFTEVDTDEHHKWHRGPFYFADVCAGPGGFSEYIFWRKGWFFKGFGFTLKNSNDFSLKKSVCASGASFNALYGSRGDGDIYYLENILDFREKVLHETGGQGVHFVMSDGGFSVEGCENLQEVLSKHLYVSQFLMALEILRSNGHFVTKMFDTYTIFSVGLIFLMEKCFEMVAIFKPNASRPANSERYFIGKYFISNENTKNIRNYFRRIVRELEILKAGDTDINEIVPLSVINQNKQFLDYMRETNNRLGRKQLIGLNKMTTFCCNPTLFDSRQDEFREKSLEHWKIPNYPKVKPPVTDLETLLLDAICEPKLLTIQARDNVVYEQLRTIIDDPNKWHYILLNSCKKCHFYAATEDSKVYRSEGNKWCRVRNVYLAKGTLLYGEIVDEIIIKQEKNVIDVKKQSLHVIDALKLGDCLIEKESFVERTRLIKIYCESINHETRTEYVRVRPKVAMPLEMLQRNIVTADQVDKSIKCHLNILTLNSTKEYYDANVLLLLKTDTSQSFTSTYVFRIQVPIREFISPYVSLKDLLLLLNSISSK